MHPYLNAIYFCSERETEDFSCFHKPMSKLYTYPRFDILRETTEIK
jgi:hypothetical protein